MLQPLGSDELSCAALVDDRVASPIGKPWDEYINLLRLSIEDKRSSIIMLQGSFGSGKTLFIRASIAEYAFIQPYIVPIYIKMRSLRGRTIASTIDVIKYALEHTSKKECLNEMIRDALNSISQELQRLPRAHGTGHGFLETISMLADRVQKRYGLHLVVFIDELEALPHYTEEEIIKAYKLYEPIKDILDHLYILASRNKGYLVVLGTVYRLIDLATVCLRKLGTARDPRAREFLQEVISAAANHLAEDIRTQIEDALVQIGRRAELEKLLSQIEFARRAAAFDLLEPGIARRIIPQTVQLIYETEDYYEITKRILPDHPSTAKRLRHIVHTAKALETPPGYLLEALRNSTEIVKQSAYTYILNLVANRETKWAKSLETLLAYMKKKDTLILSKEELEEFKNTYGNEHLALLRRQKLLEKRIVVDKDNLYHYTTISTKTRIPLLLFTGHPNLKDPENPEHELKDIAQAHLKTLHQKP